MKKEKNNAAEQKRKSYLYRDDVFPDGALDEYVSVSYTHLDVYKRQLLFGMVYKQNKRGLFICA